MDQQQEQCTDPKSTTHYKLRPSLRRTHRSSGGENENPPETLAPTTTARRVSFASSSTVKPFVNDGHNTIWDNSYEEEIHHSKSVSATDKENISPCRQTIFTPYHMEMTCRSTTITRLQVQDHKSMECNMGVNNQPHNYTTLAENDMSFTCKFSDTDLTKNPIHSMAFANPENMTLEPSGMELTCQFPQDPLKTEVDESSSSEANDSVKANKFAACLLSDKNRQCDQMMAAGDPPNTCTIKSESDMSFTCDSSDLILTKSRIQSMAFANPDDMTLESTSLEFSQDPLKNVKATKFASGLLPEENKEWGQMVAVGDSPKTCTLYSASKMSVTSKFSDPELTENRIHSMALNQANVTEKSSRSELTSQIAQCHLKSEMDFSSVEVEETKFADGLLPEIKKEYDQMMAVGDPPDTCIIYPASAMNVITKFSDPVLLENHIQSMALVKLESVSKLELISQDPLKSEGGCEPATSKLSASVVLENHITEVSSEMDNISQTTEHRDVPCKDIDCVQPASVFLDDEECPSFKADNSLCEPSGLEESILQASPPRNILYSECMKNVSKPSISIIHFSQGFSSANSTNMQFEMSANSSTGLTNSVNLINRFLGDDIEILKFSPSVYDYSQYRKTAAACSEILDRVNQYMESYQRPTSKRVSILSDRVRRLSLMEHNETSFSESLTSNASDSDNDVFHAVEIVKTLHDKIRDKFSSVKDTFFEQIKLDTHYIEFTAFVKHIKVIVELHKEDDHVVEIRTESLLDDSDKEHYAHLYNVFTFLVKHIRQKLEMTSLRSSLGTCFDILSLLDHVYIVVDKASHFLDFFILTQRAFMHFLDLDVDESHTFSFDLICLQMPPTWWSIKFRMASIEKFDLDSVETTCRGRWSKSEEIKTIMRNTEPSLDCIRKFIGALMVYFNQITRSTS